MKKLITICLLISMTFSVDAQNNNLKLNQIINLVKCSNYNDFIIQAKDLGYSYREEKKLENVKKYFYNRAISANGYDINLSLQYYDYSNNKPFIVIATSQHASINYVSEIKFQAEKLNFKEVPNSTETDLLFTDGIYKLELHITDNNKYILGLGYL